MNAMLQKILKDANQHLGPCYVVDNTSFKLNYERFNDRKVKELISKTPSSKIAYLSTYDKRYTRTEYLKILFKRNNISVDYYFYPGRYLKFLKVLWQIRDRYDVFFVSFRGHEILPFVRLIIGKQKVIIFDAFVSVYDTLCFDRKLFSPKSLAGRFLKYYDQLLGSWSNIVLVDTQTHANYFRRQLKISNIDYLYVGCNKKLFKPMKKHGSDKFVIFWYGHANPLQGVENILRWAKSLEKYPEVSFTLVGPIRERYPELLEKLQLRNVKFIDYLPYEKLPIEMNAADLCLGGHFSSVKKAQRVIAGKTYQMLACGKTVVVANNEANNELFYR